MSTLSSIFTPERVISAYRHGIFPWPDGDPRHPIPWACPRRRAIIEIEALRVLIPGLFGYRMDTPDGGAYWGAVGENPMLPQLKAAAAKIAPVVQSHIDMLNGM